jgi:6-pyruvoyltetrahydropterin/6-carboxytetrahydropterin synthase
MGVKMRSEVTKRFSIDYAHRLMYHEGKCKNLHGHTGIIEVTICGKIDEHTGMVVDFGDLKTFMRPIIQKLDHSVLINKEDHDLLLYAQKAGVNFVAFMKEPTAENIAVYIHNELINANPEYSLRVAVKFFETPDNFVKIG